MSDTLTRRGLIKKTAAPPAGAGLIAQSPSAFGQAPAVVTARRFRGWVTRGWAWKHHRAWLRDVDAERDPR